MDLQQDKQRQRAMRGNVLWDNLRDGQTALGFALTYPAPGIIEAICHGFDFVWIDSQHGQIWYEGAMEAVRTAAAMDIDSVLRVPSHEPGLLGFFADTAPSAVMVPMVNTADEARSIVEALRFAPLGTRSFGGRRPVDLFGRQFVAQYPLMVIAQIETVEAVENADEIIRTEGIDALFLGADDMRMQLGVSMDVGFREDGRLRDAMERTAQSATNAGKIAAMVASDLTTVKICRAAGYRMFAIGSDSAFLRTAATAQIRKANAILHGDDLADG